MIPLTIAIPAAIGIFIAGHVSAVFVVGWSFGKLVEGWLRPKPTPDQDRRRAHTNAVASAAHPT